MSCNLERVKEGLALIKLTRDTTQLENSNYTSAEIIEIMKHVRFLVGTEEIQIGKEGEKILNDLSMR